MDKMKTEWTPDPIKLETDYLRYSLNCDDLFKITVWLPSAVSNRYMLTLQTFSVETKLGTFDSLDQAKAEGRRIAIQRLQRSLDNLR
jgi:hypothetical protein